MAHGLEDPVDATRIEVKLAVDLGLVDDGHVEIGIEKQKRSAKAGRGNADYGEGMLVDLDDAAQHAAIVLKMAVPIVVAEYDVRRAVEAVLVACVKGTADERLNTQGVEIIPASGGDPGARGIATGINSGLRYVPCDEAFEAVTAITEIEIVGIRFLAHVIVGVFESVEAVGMGHVERSKDDTVQDGKDHGVRSDRQGQREHCGDGESGGLAQNAHAEADILHKCANGIAAECFVTFLFVLFAGAELDSGAAFRLSAREAGPLQIVGAMLDVRAQFFFEIGVEFRALKVRGNANAEPIERFHSSSGWAASAEVMAAARRFQLLVSWRRRLRPATVSE